MVFAVVIDHALQATAHALAVAVGVAEGSAWVVAVVIGVAFHAPAQHCIADTMVAVVIDHAFHAPALAGVADRRIAITISVHVAHHALRPRASTSLTFISLGVEDFIFSILLQIVPT